MIINTDTPKTAAAAAGKVLNFPQPFAEGYALTGNEAAGLNQLLIENLRNNLVGRMKKAADAGTPWDEVKAQAELDSYSLSYQFGVRMGGGKSLDPVQRISEELAEDMIKTALKAKNVKINSVSAEKMDELIAGVLAKDAASGGDLRKEAERRVKNEAKLAQLALV